MPSCTGPMFGLDKNTQECCNIYLNCEKLHLRRETRVMDGRSRPTWVISTPVKRATSTDRANPAPDLMTAGEMWGLMNAVSTRRSRLPSHCLLRNEVGHVQTVCFKPPSWLVTETGSSTYHQFFRNNRRETYLQRNVKVVSFF